MRFLTRCIFRVIGFAMVFTCVWFVLLFLGGPDRRPQRSGVINESFAALLRNH